MDDNIDADWHEFMGYCRLQLDGKLDILDCGVSPGVAIHCTQIVFLAFSLWSAEKHGPMELERVEMTGWKDECGDA